MKILLGTRNDGKIAEIRKFFKKFTLLTYQDLPFREVEEDGTSYKENAVKKALSIASETNLPVLAEDSGLEVISLDNRPGVHSSRFAGGNATDEENMDKLLDLLIPLDSRSARFRCVAALYIPKVSLILAKGELEGTIPEDRSGQQGFGYDPVFIPKSFDKTLAELGPKIKNKISHRHKALTKLRARIKVYAGF